MRCGQRGGRRLRAPRPASRSRDTDPLRIIEGGIAAARRGWPGLLLALFVVLGLAVVDDYGVGWDEPAQRLVGEVSAWHVVRTVAPDVAAARRPDVVPLDEFADRDYGVAFELPAYVVEAALGVSDSRTTYLLRHVLTFLVFVGGIVAVHRMAVARFGTASSGVLAAAFVILSPRILADGFTNSKDGVFLAAMAVALHLAIEFVVRPTPRRAAMAAVGSAAAVGVRVLGVAVPVAVVAVLLVRVARREVAPAPTARALGVHLAITSAVTVAVWPYLWSAPLGNLVAALRSMARFRWGLDVWYLGSSIPATELPWHYPLVWIAISTPLLILGAFLIGAGAIVWRMWTARAPWTDEASLRDAVLLAFAGGPVVAVVALDSVLYDGWRQLYFIQSALAVVAVRGVRVVQRSLRDRHASLERAAALAASIALATTVGWIVRAHPLQNVYVNGLVRDDARLHVDVDYWGMANRGVLERLLAVDDRPEVRVWGASFINLKPAIRMVPAAERDRIRLVEGPDEADYVVTNYRGITDPLGQDRELLAFGPLHERVVVGRHVVISVHRRADG